MVEPAVDLVVIGAGIQGAGVAQAAAAAGHSVCLVERETAPARRTSSRSSKLIHGGLRYLEGGQLGLVRECLRERRLLLRNAPHLVRLVPFFLPVYAGMRRGAGRLRVGLSLYALLGGLEAESRFRSLPRKDWSDLDGLDTNGLRAVLRYYDGQTDDAALTRAVAASAQALGTELLMSTEVTAVALDRSGATVTLRHAGQTRTRHCHAVINAAGPWVNELLTRVSPGPGPLAVDLIAGTHLLLDRRLSQGMYYVEAPADGRAVFIMPWGPQTLVGTTERLYQGDPAAIAATPAEIDYLLETHAHYFPHGPRSVVSAFAGLRVLPRSDAAAFGRSRDTLFVVDDAQRPRLLTIVGGKLTAYRATAERALRRLAPALPPRQRRTDTRTLRLPGD